MFIPFSCKLNYNDEKDEHSIHYPDTLQSIENKIFVKAHTKEYIDSSRLTIITTIWGECHVCMAKFQEWEKIRGKEPFKELQMVYIVTTPYPDYFLKVFYPEIKHSGILLIDDSDSFYSLNNLKYSQAHLNTFLVDSTLSIILQGDPLVMPGMLERYEKAIKNYLVN